MNNFIELNNQEVEAVSGGAGGANQLPVVPAIAVTTTTTTTTMLLMFTGAVSFFAVFYTLKSGLIPAYLAEITGQRHSWCYDDIWGGKDGLVTIP